jgi:hypothetical protein
MFIETKVRTLTKTITWRVVAVLNSYITLVVFSSSGDLYKAILMNISGFFAFYIFERIWNDIKWGKLIESR